MDKTMTFLNEMVALSKAFVEKTKDGFSDELFQVYVFERDKLIEAYKALEIDEKPESARQTYEELEKLDQKIKEQAKSYLDQLKVEMDKHRDDKEEQAQKKQNLRKMKKYFGIDKPVDPYYFDRKK